MFSILTGMNDATLLATLNVKEISEKWRESLGVEVGDTFRTLSAIEYWQCPTTGFCWYTPAEAAGGGELYAQLEKHNWYYMHDKWEFSAALDLLGESSTVLEVGVGEGNFLKAAQKKGHSIQGVELNPKGAARARAMGFEINELTLHELREQTNQRFDTVCAFQVLEHVPDPRQFLEGILAMLKPGGRMILAVPNAAVMRKVDPRGQELLNQPPHHMGHWDENVFRALEDFLPVKVRSVHREQMATYHVSWMVNGYLRNILSPLGRTVSRLLVNRYSTLPLQWLVRAWLRRYLPGHTLLVELEYLGS
jgi:SAM-dependent methyltransferase